jgi:hypothetical protein
MTVLKPNGTLKFKWNENHLDDAYEVNLIFDNA